MKRAAAACIVSMLCFVSVANGQDHASNSVAGGLMISTITTSPILTTGGLVMLIVMLTPKDEQLGGDAVRAAELYLRQNALQLAQDLATGRGPVVQQLADAMNLTHPNAQLLGDVLRTDRKALLDLADVERLNPERAEAFGTRLHRLMTSEPALRAELERLSAEYAN